MKDSLANENTQRTVMQIPLQSVIFFFNLSSSTHVCELIEDIFVCPNQTKAETTLYSGNFSSDRNGAMNLYCSRAVDLPRR